jgi:hypothetical protein
MRDVHGSPEFRLPKIFRNSRQTLKCLNPPFPSEKHGIFMQFYF